METTPGVGVARSSWSRLVTLGAVSILTYFGARLVLEVESIPTAWRVVAALVPVPFFSWLLYEIIRGSRQLDELQRRIHLEALAVASPVCLTILMTLGLLELVIPLNRNDWSYRHVWQMQGVIYIASLYLTQRRYGVTCE